MFFELEKKLRSPWEGPGGGLGLAVQKRSAYVINLNKVGSCGQKLIAVSCQCELFIRVLE